MKKLTPYSLYVSMGMLALALIFFGYSVASDTLVNESGVLLCTALAVTLLAIEARRLSRYRRNLHRVFGWAMHSSNPVVLANVFLIVAALLVFSIYEMSPSLLSFVVAVWMLSLVLVPKAFLFIDMCAGALLDGIPTRIAWIDRRLSFVIDIRSPEYIEILRKALTGHLYVGCSMAYTLESAPVKIKNVHWLDALDKWGVGAEQVVGKVIDELLHKPTPKYVKLTTKGPADTPVLIINLDPKDPNTK